MYGEMPYVLTLLVVSQTAKTENTKTEGLVDWPAR